MQDFPAQGQSPRGDSPQQTPSSGLDQLLSSAHAKESSKGEENQPSPINAGRIASKKSSFAKTALPLAVFVVAVGAIAWISQYQTGTTTLPKEQKKDNPLGQHLIQFVNENTQKQVGAFWSKEDPTYRLEFEKGKRGFYDFMFTNKSDETAEVGLDHLGCDCSTVQVCLLPTDEAKAHFDRMLDREKWGDIPEPNEEPNYKWKKWEVNKVEGITMPPGQSALLRLAWQGRKVEGEKLNLTLFVWSQPQGNPRQRRMHFLGAAVQMTHPVRFTKPEIDLGTLVPQAPFSTDLYCWSPTRKGIELALLNSTESDPCFKYQIKPMAAPEMKVLEDSLWKNNKIKTKVLSAYHIFVVVNEEIEGKQLDMGPVIRKMPLLVKSEGISLDLNNIPVMKGTVRSDVRVGNTKDRSAVDFGSFPSDTDRIMDEILFTDKGTKIKLLEFSPVYLQVNLTKKEKQGSSASETAWNLHLRVPRNRLIGNLQDENAVILLQSIRPDGQVRRIRIPIRGTATVN